MVNVYIGVRGAKRSGKDTFAMYLRAALKQYFDLPMPRTSFAKRLREAVALIFGFDPEFVFSDDFKEFVTHVYPLPDQDHSFDHNSPLTGRELLQYFGSEVCREMDNDCWARAPFTDVERKYTHAICLITDLRFPNEVEHLHKHHSLVVKVERPGYNGDGHISERALDDFNDDDYVIENSGTEKDLVKEAKKLAAVIAERLNRAED